MIIIHTVYCVLGRTGSGKSTVTKEASKQLNMSILRSYSTRKYLRQGETKENSDHILISPDEIEKYRNDMIAYTDRVGYCNFATKQQLLDNDFYIINPTGYYELKLKTKDMDIELVTIMVNVPYNDLRQRAKKRGDYDAWQANYIKESEEFSSFEKSHLVDYFILNDRSIEESVAKMVRIINKDRAKREMRNDSARNLVTSNAKENICFGRTYSWNKDWTGKRLQNWAEIRQYLLGIGKEVTKEK